MISVDIISESECWDKKLLNSSFFFNKIMKNLPEKYQFRKKKVNLTVLLSNNQNIKKLNKKFRNINKPTDVLSFPFEKKPNKKKEIYLGDIIISYEFMNKPSLLIKTNFKENVIKTFIHGFLHLLDYDHIKLKDYKAMNKQEITIYSQVSKKIEKLI